MGVIVSDREDGNNSINSVANRENIALRREESFAYVDNAVNAICMFPEDVTLGLGFLVHKVGTDLEWVIILYGTMDLFLFLGKLYVLVFR
jgi:hypothetical protein